MKKAIVFLLICQVFIFSSCFQDESFRNKDLNPKLKKVISDTYVNEIRYSNEDFQKIYDLAKKYGIENPYLPTRGKVFFNHHL